MEDRRNQEQSYSSEHPEEAAAAVQKPELLSPSNSDIASSLRVTLRAFGLKRLLRASRSAERSKEIVTLVGLRRTIRRVARQFGTTLHSATVHHATAGEDYKRLDEPELSHSRLERDFG